MNILSIGSHDIDGFALRKGAKELDTVCKVFSMEWCEAVWNVVEERGDSFDALVVDFEGADEEAVRGMIDLVSQEDEMVIVAITSEESPKLAHELYGAGADVCICPSPDGGHLELVPQLISKRMDERAAVDRMVRAREWVRRLEREREALIGACLTLITYHDNDGNIIWSNAFEVGADGLAVDQLAGRNVKDIWRDGGRKDGMCPLTDTLMSGMPREAEVISVDGFRMLQRTQAIKDPRGQIAGAVASTLDTSVLTPVEEAIKAAARAQASATLAGGIAHKFNNLMAGVMGNVGLLMEEVKGEQNIGLLREVEGAAQVAGELSDQLLAFARGGKYLPKVLDLNEVIRESIQVRGKEIPEGIEVSFEFDPNLGKIEANQAQIALLVNQLCDNAAESIEETGSITIRTFNESVEGEIEPGKPWIDPGKYVVFAVEDTGVGLTPEAKSKIFEPFYSTKESGRGLGLAAAYGVVRSHGGHIAVESEVGEGTKIVVFLPETNLEALPIDFPEPKPAAPVKAAPPRGDETILIVDDEDMVRKAMVRSLRRLGYDLLEARNGKEAVELTKTHDGVIHLVLLDMIMPGMDGMESFRLLKEQRPDAEFIVMSGYDRGTYEGPMLKAGARSFLQKPVTMDALAVEVRDALDGGDQPAQ